MQHRTSADVEEAELAGGQQRVYGFFHARARYEVSEEAFKFGGLGGDYAVEILREQRRKRLLHRKSNAFLDGIRRPAVKHVPERAFVRLVVDTRDAQLGRQFAQRLVERGERNAAAQRLL